VNRVLVTGAGGFIGRYCLSELLQRGFEVHASSSRPVTEGGGEVVWHRADLLDPAQTAALVDRVRPSHLLHLAWYTVPGQYWTSPENLRWVEGSLHLFLEFARKSGRRVVAAGSCSEYDWRAGTCGEATTALAPTSLYGTAKHAVQLLLAAFAQEAGLSAAWARIFYVFGPHEPPERLVPQVVTSLLRREPARCSHGAQRRDFLYVKDVASALAALLASPVTGPVNIGSGKAIPLAELIVKIAEVLGGSRLVGLSGVTGGVGEPELVVADVRRLHEEVGWQPAHSLEQGIEETEKWWRKQLFGAGS
jgi:nucleoside-diphosphate-sugar epimerase